MADRVYPSRRGLYSIVYPTTQPPIHPMKRTCLTLLLAAFIIPLSLSAGEALPILAIPIMDEAARVDGVLDEPVWDKAGSIDQFGEVVEGGPGQGATQVAVWADKDNLFLGWVCQDSAVHATFTGRDKEFWLEEVAEFFVTVDGLNEYFELQWNPLGGTFDAIIHNPIGTDGGSLGIKGDWSFTAENMQWAVVNDTEKHVCTVEVKIPFADLGQEPISHGTVWQANFYRVNADGKGNQEFSSWSPIHRSGFHQPLRFGRLVFYQALDNPESKDNP